MVVKVCGEVDLCTAPDLATELDRALQGQVEIVVDLDKVEFMDCAGLRVLVDAAELTDRITITRAPAQVQKLFELTKTHEVLTIVTPPPARAIAPWAGFDAA